MVNVFNYFPTIQGEGRSIGKGVFLIRTWGCNYTCKWCDISEVSQCRSKYKKLKLTNNEYHELLNSIEKALSRYSIDILLITGGEPTIYFTPENRELWNQIALRKGKQPPRVDIFQCLPHIKTIIVYIYC